LSINLNAKAQGRWDARKTKPDPLIAFLVALRLRASALKTVNLNAKAQGRRGARKTKPDPFIAFLASLRLGVFALKTIFRISTQKIWTERKRSGRIHVELNSIAGPPSGGA
jgi:hypothetical protein